MSDGGKGSKPRPFSVSHDEWSTRWDVIFSRDKISMEIEKEKQEIKQEEEEKQTEQN